MQMKKEVSLNKIKKDAEDLFRGGFFLKILMKSTN